MKINQKWFYFLPAGIYCALIFFLSGNAIKIRLGIIFWDKGAHWLEFSALGFLLALGFFKNLPDRPFLRAYLTFMTGIFIGLLDELHQLFVPGRTCDWKDWLADLAGIAFGLTVYWIIHLETQDKNPKTPQA